MIWPFRSATTKPADIDPAHLRQARAGLPWLRGLGAQREARLHGLATEFLHEKTITPLQGLHLNDIQRLRLALLCIRIYYP